MRPVLEEVGVGSACRCECGAKVSAEPYPPEEVAVEVCVREVVGEGREEGREGAYNRWGAGSCRSCRRSPGRPVFRSLRAGVALVRSQFEGYIMMAAYRSCSSCCACRDGCIGWLCDEVVGVGGAVVR